MPLPLTQKAIADLRRFCTWLDTVPRKSVYPSTLTLTAVSHKLPPCPEETLYWLSDVWKVERKHTAAIFYASGWGWRLRKQWKERLAQLESELLTAIALWETLFWLILLPIRWFRRKTKPRQSQRGKTKKFGGRGYGWLAVLA